jgi:metallo-beta-lactamase family protein
MVANTLRIMFNGAIDTVTGSATLLEYKSNSFTGLYLIDAGAYQSEKTDDNHELLLSRAKDIKIVFLTHAHYDHVGFLPELIQNGFTGKVYCTRATCLIATEILRDSLKIQNMDKTEIEKIIGKVNFFRLEDEPNFQFGRKIITLTKDFQVGALRSAHVLGSCSYYFKWTNETYDKEDNSTKKWQYIHFSGDVGPVDNETNHSFLLKDHNTPYYGEENKFVVLESTYGDRVRDKDRLFENKINALEKIITGTLNSGGIVLIPAFAFHRAQELLIDLCYINKTLRINKYQKSFLIKKNKKLEYAFASKNEIFDDSFIDKLESICVKYLPNGYSAEMLFSEMNEEMITEIIQLLNEYAEGVPARVCLYSTLAEKINTVYKSSFLDSFMTQEGDIKYTYAPNIFFDKFNISGTEEANKFEILAKSLDVFRIDDEKIESELEIGRKIIISSSGMCDEGKIVKILKNVLRDENNCIVLSGYQAEGTNGYMIKNLSNYTEQEKYNIQLKGVDLKLSEIKCRIEDVSKYYSGHADQEQLVEYIHGYKNKLQENTFPTKVFINHGTTEARNKLKEALLNANRDQHKVEVINPKKNIWYNLSQNCEEEESLNANKDTEQKNGKIGISIGVVDIYYPNEFPDQKVGKLVTAIHKIVNNMNDL